MEKIIKDGKVAVAISPGFGSGWSTWNDVHPCDARFNQLFLEGKYQEADDLCEELDLGYGGGAYDVVIKWVELGKKFIITEYDGSESIMLETGFNWIQVEQE